ncbi:uncharacterized protein LOC133031300 [Cannabis sativa]|uniref:uncharacterized protein LOC133031300 n=1 Tax=Cannabis sativa TaxID=3483 RepID=UPI0029C9BF22|nr:uncharacterized protein LOC133031300 [Cannabis sativa]
MWHGLSCLNFPIKPWLIMEDFNAVFDFGDRSGGNQVSKNEIEDATNWAALGLADSLQRFEPSFTWSTTKRLMTDHCSCIVSSAKASDIGIKPFKFFYFWVHHKDYKQVILDSWNKLVRSNGLKGLFIKCMRLKHQLRIFNKKVGDIEVQHAEVKARLQEAKLAAQANPGDLGKLEEEKRVAMEFSDKEKLLHRFLVQRSKANWLKKGDDNTAYFCACIKKRRENRIVHFTTEKGQLVEEYPKVVKHFINHFQSYMGSHHLPTVNVNIFNLKGNKLSLDMKLALSKPFSKKEIKMALFSIPSSNRTGPDGFNTEFFKSMWREI